MPEIINPFDEVHRGNAARQQPNNSDTGNFKRFLQLHGSNVKYMSENGAWWLWRGTNWDLDAKGEVLELTETISVDIRNDIEDANFGADRRAAMEDHALRTENVSRRKNILELAKTNPRITCSYEDFNKQIGLLATPTGVVELATGTVRDPRPDDMITACTSVPYDPDARSDLLEEEEAIFLPDKEMRQLFYDVTGTALIGGNLPRIFPILKGATTSGKSMFTATMQKILGNFMMPVSASIFRNNIDDKPRPDIMSVLLTRIAYISELSQEWSMDTDQIKRWTGHDMIPIRDLFKSVVFVRPLFTPFIITNELPKVKTPDLALKRRIVVIEFTPLPPNKPEEPGMRNIFMNDLDVQKTILRKLVDGARSEFAREGVSSLGPYALRLREDVFKHLNPIEVIIEELIANGKIMPAPKNITRSSCIKAIDLYNWYKYWITRYGDHLDRHNAVSLTAFGKSLRESGHEKVAIDGSIRYLDWILVDSLVPM